MPATTLNSIVFRDIFTTEDMRRVFSDEQRIAYYLEFEAALARVQARLEHHSGRGRAGDRADLPRREHRFRQAQEADRAHRLSGPAGGAADRGEMRQGLGRVVPLGRDHPGHHRHRDRDADPRRAGARRDGHGGDRRLARRPFAALPRHADGGTQQPATGGPDHVRLQGRLAAGGHAAASPAPRRAAPARAGGRVRRRRRHPVLARHRRARRSRPP